MTRDWRDARIAEQDAQIAQLKAELAERDRTIEELMARVEELMAQVADLEEKLRQSSKNSSKPPSSDPPWLLHGSKKSHSGRKPGGQPGHRKTARALLPPEKVDETHDLWPTHCEGCQKPLRSEARVEVGEVVRHQVIEVPEVRARVTEYRVHTQCCPHCEWATSAKVPEGVRAGPFGPRLTAVIALCSGVYRLSKRQVVSIMSDLFGVDLALGSVTACEQRTSEALAEPVAEARRYVEQQPVVYADETGWRQTRERAWVWVAVTSWVTVFLIHVRRNASAAQQLLGQFAGILVTDRWSAYTRWSVRHRQLCWAHLLRYFKAFSECPGAAGALGEKLLALTRDMFLWWHRVRDGTLARATFQANMRPVRHEIESLLEKGSQCGHPKVEATCRGLLALAPALWTFVRVAGVEPTSNAAERALRACVLMRKTSFGTHSESGSRFIERMLTVAATLRQQKRNVVHYVTDAVERSFQGQKVPSILPTNQLLRRELLLAA